MLGAEMSIIICLRSMRMLAGELTSCGMPVFRNRKRLDR